MKDHINLKEAADMIGVYRTTLQKWIEKDIENKKNNIFPDRPVCPRYGKIGARYRFIREDVEQFIKDSMNR